MQRNAIREGDFLVCLGGGYFGAKAARLARECKARTIIIDTGADCAAREVVDVVLTKPAPVEAGRVALIVGDAMGNLFHILKEEVPRWIIPAVPGHAMGRLVRDWLVVGGLRPASGGDLVDEVLSGLPRRLVLSADEESGVIKSSYMDEGKRCRAGCTEPRVCPVTGCRKPAPLYELLEFSVSRVVDCGKIFISRQFDGVGGIPGAEVKRALKHLAGLRPPYSLAVGTACGCHGAVSLFKVG